MTSHWSRRKVGRARADPNHYALQDYHGEFAAVLATVGRDVEARDQHELALAHALREDAGAGGAGVSIARYFLGEHLLKMSEPAQALAIVQDMSMGASRHNWLLRVVEAKALWALGRRAESREVAATAVELAPTEQKASDIREHLTSILDPPDEKEPR
jgi:hypothetical protein